MFDAVVFAGGGNRCYWQGGFYEAAAPRLRLNPKLVVAASAGAFAATIRCSAPARPRESWCSKAAARI
jgi:predicted acylesterase/phospholipase RssA